MGSYACTVSFQAIFTLRSYPGSAVLHARNFDLRDGAVLGVVPTTDCIDTGYLPEFLSTTRIQSIVSSADLMG